jgi:hypothetical protein
VSSHYEDYDLDLGGRGLLWARPDLPGPPGTRFLPSFSCCMFCHGTLPKRLRCTEESALMEAATAMELFDGVGRGAACVLDREDELERRERLGVFDPIPPPRPGFLVRLKRRLR